MAYEPNENTIAYWPLDDPHGATDNTGSAADLNSNVPLTQATVNLRPAILGGPNTSGGQNCRWWYGTNQMSLYNAAPPAGFNSLLIADFTIEAWIRPTTLAVNQFIFGRQNWNVAFYVGGVSGLGLGFYWQSPGDNYVTTSSGTIPLDTWTHVAATVEVLTGTRYVILYINGIAVNNGSGTNATAGGSAGMALGNMYTGFSRKFAGGIADVRLSNIKRSPAEILASAQAVSKQHTNDGNTYSLWRLNEAPGLQDLGKGNHIPYGSSMPQTHQSLLYGYGPGKARGTRLDVSATLCPAAIQRSELLTAFQGNAKSWTFNVWYQKRTAVVYAQGLFAVYGGTTADPAYNTQGTATVRTDYRMSFTFENGTKSAVNYVTTNTMYPSSEHDWAHMLSVVRDDQGDGTSIIHFYTNGVLIESSTPLANPTGGNNMTIYLMEDSTTTEVRGYFDDASFTAGVRTAEDLRTEYLAGSLEGLLTTGQHYKMRALADPGPGYVTWVVDSYPDFAGDSAPSAIQVGTAVVTSSWGIEVLQQVPRREVAFLQSVNAPTTVTDPAKETVMVEVDTSAGTWSANDTLLLPATPLTDCGVIVKDVGDLAATKPIVVDGNGNLIDGSSSKTIQTDREARHFVFNGTFWSTV